MKACLGAFSSALKNCHLDSAPSNRNPFVLNPVCPLPCHPQCQPQRTPLPIILISSYFILNCMFIHVDVWWFESVKTQNDFSVDIKEMPVDIGGDGFTLYEGVFPQTHSWDRRWQEKTVQVVTGAWRVACRG